MLNLKYYPVSPRFEENALRHCKRYFANAADPEIMAYADQIRKKDAMSDSGGLQLLLADMDGKKTLVGTMYKPLSNDDFHVVNPIDLCLSRNTMIYGRGPGRQGCDPFQRNMPGPVLFLFVKAWAVLFLFVKAWALWGVSGRTCPMFRFFGPGCPRGAIFCCPPGPGSAGSPTPRKPTRSS